MTARLAGRLALVTGASRGIGRAAAIALGGEGAHVICLARTVGGLEETDDLVRAKGGTTTLVPLDIKDFDGLDRLGASIHERWGKLDIMIANAGVLGPLSPIGHVPPKDWMEVIDVNLTANFRLIRSLDPLLKLSDAGRAIFVTSNAARANRAYWGPYAASKAGLDSLALTYAAECAKSNVRVNLVNPGHRRTKMRAEAMPGENPESVPLPEGLGPLFVELCDPACHRHGELIKA